MEFLHSRAFRIYLLITLGITLLALVITLLITLISGSGPGGDASNRGGGEEGGFAESGSEVGESSESRMTPGFGRNPLPSSLDPETLFIPDAWETPGRVELRFFREPDLPWSVSRLSPWWTPPEEILKEEVETTSDREVRTFLEQIP